VRAVIDAMRSGSLYLPESETRFLRLILHDGPARAYGLAEIEVKDLAFGASPNAFSRLSRARRHGDTSHAGFPMSNPIGQSSASTAEPKKGCSPKTGRSR